MPGGAQAPFSFNVFITPCSRVRRSYTPKQSSCIALYSPPLGSWVEEESELMLNLRRTREPRGERHAKANSSFPLRLVGARSGLRPTRTASGFPSTPSARIPLITLTDFLCAALLCSFPGTSRFPHVCRARVSPLLLLCTWLLCAVTFLGCTLVVLIISFSTAITRVYLRACFRARFARFIAQHRQQGSSAETSTEGALQLLPAWPSSRFNTTLMCFLAHMA